MNTDEHGNLIHKVTTQLVQFSSLKPGDRIWNALTGMNYMTSPIVTKVERNGADITYWVDRNEAYALESLKSTGSHNSSTRTITRQIG